MDFKDLERELLGIVHGEKNLIANLANISSVIFHSYQGLNWCGFYLWVEDDQELVLGPFQGKPACLRIKSGKGVCGTSFANKKSVLVHDVHLFPGHIACDAASESELVIPLIKDGKIFGVLDMDAPKKKRFSEEDEKQFQTIMNKVVQEIY